MGGEGGGVLADWIVDMAERGGYLAQATSVPGLAQRTGQTLYYIELFAKAAARDQEPVLALMPVPGDVDVVLASELMEAARAIARGLVTPDRTTLIASTHRVYTMNERLAMTDGRVDADALLKACQEAAGKLHAFDMASIAEATGSLVSAPCCTARWPVPARCHSRARPSRPPSGAAVSASRPACSRLARVSRRRRQARVETEQVHGQAAGRSSLCRRCSRRSINFCRRCRVRW